MHLKPENGWTGFLREGADVLLAADPDPAVTVRVLRDVIGAPEDEPRLVGAKRSLDTNPGIRQLASSQRDDGGWGRFHSRDTSLKAAVPTTEWGIRRCSALGVDAKHPIGRKAVRYLEGLLEGRAPFPDPPERNDRWRTGVDLFVASTLALLEPGSPALEPNRKLWLAILERTFAEGEYDAGAEMQAHRELTGATVAGSYLEIGNRYVLALLGSGPQPVLEEVLRAYADWVAQVGAGYLEVPVLPPVNPTASVLDRWLTTLELLSPFPGASGRLKPAVGWLVDRRRPDGLWDLGPRSAGSPSYPISADWRSAARRRHDHTTRILSLLAAACAP